MEAVPRLLMIKIDLKEFQDYAATDWMDGIATDETIQDAIREQINKHIRSVYSDDPNKYKDCVNNFLELQSSAYKVFQAPDMEGCNTLKKYYGQLHYMQSRFPFVGDDALQVSFTWSDAFTGRFTQQSSFVYEQAAILFNLGAIHSYLGSLDTRASDEGTKISCVHFQCAAGFFQYIADHLDTTLSPDISQFMLKLYTNTMLGQGQECLLEKSMQDNRKNSIIAKISQQVVDYYELSLNSLGQTEAKQVMGDANKRWQRILNFKVVFYSAIAKYYLGNDDWEQEKYGTGLSYFGSALQSYNECMKLVKNLKGDVRAKAEEALAYSADVFTGRHTSAKKDNEFIYHEKVPDPATLPTAKGASLVKPLPFDPSNAAVTGPDIFAKLVPLEAHLTASTYSEEKAKLLRPILAEVEEKNSVLEQYKRAIDFDIDKLIKIDDEDRLDPILVEHCARLSVDQTPIQELTKAIKDLSNVYMDIDSLICETVSLLEQEKNETTQVKEVCGKTVESSDEVEKLNKELDVCKDVHEKAAQMNDDLHTAMKVHIDNLRIVSEGLNALKDACSFANTCELITEEDMEVISTMEKLCSKVTEMETQRQSLVASLRSQLEDDDVTSALMTNPGIDAEDLFKEELKKHDSVIGYIKQNLAAQENILNAVTEANVKYAKIKKVVDNHKKKVQSKCNNFLLSCTDYTAAVKRCEEGTQFFREVLEQVKQTNQKAVALNEKNSKLRKIIIDKHEVKRPPPRPTAPKPKIAAVAKPGTSLFSSEELADLAAEDMEEFNDPAFLNYLRMSGGLPSGMPTLGVGGKLHSRLMQDPSFSAPQLPPSRFSSPGSVRPVSNFTPSRPQVHRPPASNQVYPQQGPGGRPVVAQHPPPTRSPQPQFTTLGPHPIMSAQQNSSLHPGASPTPQVLPSNSQPVSHGPTLPSVIENPLISQQPGFLGNQPQSFPQYRQSPHSQGQAVPPAAHPISQPQSGKFPHGQVSQPHETYQTNQIEASRFQQPQIRPQVNSSSPNYPPQGQRHVSQTSQPQSFAQNTQQPNQPSLAQLPQNFQNQVQPTNAQFSSAHSAHPPQNYTGHPTDFQVSQSAQQFSHPTHPKSPPSQNLPRSNQVPVQPSAVQFPQQQHNFQNPAQPRHQIPQNYQNLTQTRNQVPQNNSQFSQSAVSQPSQQPIFQQPNRMMGPPTSAPQNYAQFAQHSHGPLRPSITQTQQRPGQFTGPAASPSQQQSDRPALQQPIPQTFPQNSLAERGQPAHNQSSQQFRSQTPPNQPYRQVVSQVPPNQSYQMRPQAAPNQPYQQIRPQVPPNQQHQQVRLPPPNQNQKPMLRNQQFSPCQPATPQNFQQVQQHTRPPFQCQPPASPQVRQQPANRPPFSQSGAQINSQHAAQITPGPSGYPAPVPASQSQMFHTNQPVSAPNYSQQQTNAQFQVLSQMPGPAGHPEITHTSQPSFPVSTQAQPIMQTQQSVSTHNAPQQAAPVPNIQNMSEPLAPTVVGGAKLDTPMEPSKPSADLEGLTYIPSTEILLPTIANTSSADELLNASPEQDTSLVREQKTLLVPTKVDGEEMIVARIDELPYNNEADLMKFKSETEGFQKQISTLLLKKPGSLCQLDKDWKQLSEFQERSARQQSAAVGRCSSYKNRFQDILPFDQNRIALVEGKDDYINASMVDGVNKYCPRFIATQSPLPSSCGDFWTMIHEQYVTVVVMLVGNNEIPKKCAKYWPTDRNVPQKHGSLSVTFTTSRTHGNYIERTFTLKHAKSSLPRSLTQLQYTAWPDHGQPSSLRDLLSFMDVVSSFHVQQRSIQWPIAVHCENGVGHTGTFCSAYACIKYLDAGLGIPNVLEVVEKMRTKRKYMLQEKAQLKLVHDLVSIRAVELLRQRGVVIDNQPPASQIMNKIVSPPPSASDKTTFDVFGSSAISSIQASVEKMTVKSPVSNQQPTPASNASMNSIPDVHSPANISTLIGNNISDLVQGTISVQTPEPTVALIKPDVISDCRDLDKQPNAEPPNQSVPSNPVSRNQTETSLSPNLSTTSLPTGLSHNNQGNPAIGSTSLLDQLTPEAFTLGSEVKEKKRITKADFFKSDSGIGANKNSADPFADLDPLWGLKK